jgi:hypothetical protein
MVAEQWLRYRGTLPARRQGTGILRGFHFRFPLALPRFGAGAFGFFDLSQFGERSSCSGGKFGTLADRQSASVLGPARCGPNETIASPMGRRGFAGCY